MDIHPPDKPIHSIKDFVVHILVVTIGILIALGLEALIEAHRDHQLVEHARADFRAEFAGNRAALIADRRAEVAVIEGLGNLIHYGHARLAKQPVVFPKVEPSRRFVTVQATAWQTATATQALLHLPFAETRVLSTANFRQINLNTLQAHAEEQWFEIAAYGDLRSLPPEDMKAAVQKLTVAYAYLMSSQSVEIRLIKDYDAALAALGTADR